MPKASRRISVTAAETSREPPQPSRFEKKRNKFSECYPPMPAAISWGQIATSWRGAGGAIGDGI
jgi:hypothetical protein